MGTDQRSVAEILSGNASTAEKVRDLLGVPLTITDVVEVQTRKGSSTQFTATDDDDVQHTVWASSVIADQLNALEENGHLPIRLVPVEIESQNGRSYFALQQPDD